MIQTSRLAYQMLWEQTQFVIQQIKAPLQTALVVVAKRFTGKFGNITKTNTVSLITHSLLDIQAQFLDYEVNPRQKELFQSALTIIISQVETDPEYRWWFNYLVEETIKKILAGEWEPRPLNSPKLDDWNEPRPYGGEHSIIYKLMQHREEIKSILQKEERQGGKEVG